MSFLTPKLPLTRNKTTGYKLIDDYVVLVKQNFKNLLLTVPGERIMFPNFGVGIKEYLFDQSSSVNFDEVERKIRNQVNTWAPYIKLENIQFDFLENQMNITIKYSVPSAQIFDVLNLNLTI